MMTEDELKQVFSNWKELLMYHRVFLKFLKERIDSWNDETSTIGDIFENQVISIFLATYLSAHTIRHRLYQSYFLTFLFLRIFSSSFWRNIDPIFKTTMSVLQLRII